MDLTDSIESFLSAFGPLSAYSGLTPPSSAEDVLNMTVGEYRSLLNLAEAAISSIDSSLFAAILNNPQIPLDPVARAQLEAFAAGDFSIVTDAINAARTAVSPYSDQTLLSEALNGIDPSGETTAAIQQAFADAEAQLQNALWDVQNGIFSSPIFSVDPDTGIWSVAGPGGVAYSGSTLTEFFDAVGQAIGNAMLAYLSDTQSLVDQLINEGATANSFAAAQSAVEQFASNAIGSLQTLSAELLANSGNSPAAIEAQVTAQMEAMFNGLTSVLPAVASALQTFVMGSRNSDPMFVSSFDGNLDGSEHGDYFYLSKQGDTFNGGADSDVLFGLEGNDSLDGGADRDALFGGQGDDDLTGGAGDDDIHGGEGNGDKANYAGGLGQFNLRMASNGTVEIEDRTGAEGTDLLTGIETLSFGEGASIFANGQVNLRIFQGITGLNQEEIDAFIELYIAYFNRAPDAIGLNFWGSAFANGTTLAESAALFLDQDETRATYPADATNLEFAQQVYANVLGRIPDQAGLNFWVNQLDSNNVSRGVFILEVLKGAKADPAPGADQAFIDLQLADRQYLSDKTDIGTYYAVTRGLSDVDDASAAMQLYMRGDANSIQTAVNQIDQDFADASMVDSGEVIMQLVGVADNPFDI